MISYRGHEVFVVEIAYPTIVRLADLPSSESPIVRPANGTDVHDAAPSLAVLKDGEILPLSIHERRELAEKYRGTAFTGSKHRHADNCANPLDDSHVRCRQAIPVIRAAVIPNPPTRPCRICGSSPCNPADHVFASASGPSEPRTFDEMFAAARAAVSKFERRA